jgi:hypothetical protein
MPTAVAGGAPAGMDAAGGGTNPFWQVTNLYARKNKQGGVSSLVLDGNTHDGGGAIDAVGFLRGLRLMVRTTVAGSGVTGVPAADNPGNFFKYLGLQNTDGTEIQQNLIGGYARLQAYRAFRPWLQDPMTAYDYAQSLNPSLTYFMQPEVRQQLGVLENTDTRQQYSWTQTINNQATLGITGGTGPTVSVTPYVDVWSQPDVADLEGVSNERIPAGVNFQTKMRHYTFTLAAAGADNPFLSPLTGNALRGLVLVVRDSNLARQDYLGNPLLWQLDDRTLSTVDIDVYLQWANDFYNSFSGNRQPRPQGVYFFPRFFNMGAMYGQGWLYTSNATSNLLETSTIATGANLPGTVELIQEEVYNVGAIDTNLLDL